VSAIQPFQFDGTDVRVVTRDGEPWFVAADVCSVLGIANARDAVGRLDDDEKGVGTTDTLGGPQQVAIVNEHGVYALTFTSRKPQAKAFKRWITHEVIPSIRRTGSYAAPALTGPQLMAAALIEAQATMEQQSEQLAIAAPKAEAFDAFLATTGDYSVNEAAKVLSRHHDILTGERRLRGWMEANGWIYRDGGKPRAYQRRLDQGVLDEKAQWHYHPETGEKVLDTPQVRVTAKGIDALSKALLKVVDQGEFDVEGGAA
jgi:prophage antirepressor-like protein